MISYASVPLASRKVYVPIEHVTFFDDHPNADWDPNKNDVNCPDHGITFSEVTKLSPVLQEGNTIVWYEGAVHPRTIAQQHFTQLDLNREY